MEVTYLESQSLSSISNSQTQLVSLGNQHLSFPLQYVEVGKDSAMYVTQKSAVLTFGLASMSHTGSRASPRAQSEFSPYMELVLFSILDV